MTTVVEDLPYVSGMAVDDAHLYFSFQLQSDDRLPDRGGRHRSRRRAASTARDRAIGEPTRPVRSHHDPRGLARQDAQAVSARPEGVRAATRTSIRGPCSLPCTSTPWPRIAFLQIHQRWRFHSPAMVFFPNSPAMAFPLASPTLRGCRPNRATVRLSVGFGRSSAEGLSECPFVLVTQMGDAKPRSRGMEARGYGRRVRLRFRHDLHPRSPRSN